MNAESENWYKHDKTSVKSYKRAKLDVLTSQFRLQQIIEESAHILVKSSPCIDLIFTSHQKLI